MGSFVLTWLKTRENLDRRYIPARAGVLPFEARR
jgi:hypothetical protein